MSVSAVHVKTRHEGSASDVKLRLRYAHHPLLQYNMKRKYISTQLLSYNLKPHHMDTMERRNKK